MIWYTIKSVKKVIIIIALHHIILVVAITSRIRQQYCVINSLFLGENQLIAKHVRAT